MALVFQRGDDVRPRLLRQALALLQGVYRTEVYAIIHIRPAATLYGIVHGPLQCCTVRRSTTSTPDIVDWRGCGNDPYGAK